MDGRGRVEGLNVEEEAHASPRADTLDMNAIANFVARIVEGRDLDLGGHLQRVAVSAESFAQYIGCSSKDVALVSIGSRLHDLGKLSISEHILNKPGRLTALEFSLVKQHTVIGGQLLEPLGIDSRISEIVVHHHENFDGSGYPHGLVGAAIPLFARIVRLWDSFDALTSDRPYHKGVPVHAALEVMQRDEAFYDPVLLRLFCEKECNVPATTSI